MNSLAKLIFGEEKRNAITLYRDNEFLKQLKNE